MEEEEKVELVKEGKGYRIITQHLGTGSACGLSLTEDCYRQLKRLFTEDEYTLVQDEEPIENIQLLAKDPSGNLHLTSWRAPFSVFSCQNKQECSLMWLWKQV